MIDLKEMQFEILPSEDSMVDGFAFGIGRDISVNNGGFTPHDADYITQDGTNQSRGTTMFGRDIMTAASWAWSMHTDMEDIPGALQALSDFRKFWNPPNGRYWEPGVVTTLRYRMGDRVRRVYGRPRRYSAPPANEIISGLVPVSADFRLTDPFIYDDDLQTKTLSWAADGVGGFVLPQTLPFSTLPAGTDAGSVLVGGDTATYPVVRFNGPVVDPALITESWSLQVRGELAADSHIVVDLRPWHLTAIKDDTASVAGKLGRRQRLEDMVFEPGIHNLTFRGSASSGGASCTVSWRNARSTL